jgi:hypothetical protein
MKKSQEGDGVLGKRNGRKVALDGHAGVHRSGWYPEKHPGTCEIPYLLYPLSITEKQNRGIRHIWRSSFYKGKDFAPFNVKEVPGKYALGQVLACGLKASNATYSQHWQGMYFDWTFNTECREAFSKMREAEACERFSENAFATVAIISTGYKGEFMDILNLRHKPVPPSISTLENLDMGTFEHNLMCAVGAVLGGHIGVNVISHSLSADLIQGPNREGYEMLRELVMLPGMDQGGRIVTLVQLGFKQVEDRYFYEPAMMSLAGAKLIERKSERRNADFSRRVPDKVMDAFVDACNFTLSKRSVRQAVRMHITDGTTMKGKVLLSLIRNRVKRGMDKACAEVIEAYELNRDDPRFGSCDLTTYRQYTELIIEMGKKVLKPREDGHRIVFLAVDTDMARRYGLVVDVVEQAVGEALQCGLNSIHLDGTTGIPDGDDLRYGAFCMTGPIHAAEILDPEDLLQGGRSRGFTDLLSPDIRPGDRMQAVISICAKREQDAVIAERQAMEKRKSVNDIFWYRTWNHAGGKKLNLPHWISFANVLNVIPIEDNDVLMMEQALSEHLPEDHPVTEKITAGPRKP